MESSIPPPPSSRGSIPPAPHSRASLPAPPPEPTARELYTGKITAFLEVLGDIGILTRQTFAAFFRRPFEIRSTIYQIESLGVRSLGIVVVTSVFIGMVMTVQFALGLRRFGGVEYIPRVIVLSFLRELGPTLTAVIVGGRIGSGMAAEVGAMNVTEQVDAIRALGGDPAKKLVLPRVVAAIVVMPLLSMFANTLGTLGAIAVCALEFDITPTLFVRGSLEVVKMMDLFAGLAKTPFFGFIIAIVGCHFGLATTGGTEGVGQSTTRTVVVISIAILIADYFLTRLAWVIGMS
jgi:phospholipid/cholesterol/gamma-HCH transport system permease protein